MSSWEWKRKTIFGHVRALWALMKVFTQNRSGLRTMCSTTWSRSRSTSAEAAVAASPALRVNAYTGAAKSADDDCFNQRSEFYWNLRKLFVTGKIAGNIDEDTKEQLCATKYTIQNGKVKVMPKDLIKKELSRSPDDADGLMLTYAPIDNMTAIDDIIVPGRSKHNPKEVANINVDHWYPQN